MKMVRIVILHGSPRKNHNSDTLVEKYLEGFKSKITVQEEHFYLNEMNISPCQGCLYCEHSVHHQCKIQDDMQKIYKSYKTADIVIYSTPMYWGYLTGQMKVAVDRMESLAWEGFGGKTVVVIMTYRHHYESAENFFKRIAPFFHLDLHTFPCQTYNPETQEDIHITELSDKLSQIYKLGEKMAVR